MQNNQQIQQSLKVEQKSYRNYQGNAFEQDDKGPVFS